MSDNNNNYLWTDESVFCTCGHHIECHHTGMGVLFWPNSFYANCYYKDKHGEIISCNCKEFIPYKKKELKNK